MLKRLTKFLTTPTQKGLAPQIHTNTALAYHMLGSPSLTPARYENLALEGYQKNAVVFRCVRLIADAAARVEWQVIQDGHPNPNHPFARLLQQPNPVQGHLTFFRTVFSHLLLAGNAYIEAVCEKDGTPVALYALRPDRIHIDTHGGQSYYIDTVGGHQRRIPFDAQTGASRILHLKLFHPLNDWYGMSPLEALALTIDQHNAVARHNLALLQNGGRPSGVLIVKSAPGRTLGDEASLELREKLNALYQGANNAGRMMMLEGEFEWKEMGLSPKDLDFLAGKMISAREIAQAYGIPPVLLGLGQESALASQHYAEARLYLWEDTILPLLDHVMENVSAWLRLFCGPTVGVTYDPDRIEALAPRRHSLWERVQQADFLTTAEKRDMLGLSPLAGEPT